MLRRSYFQRAPLSIRVRVRVRVRVMVRVRVGAGPVLTCMLTRPG